MLSAQMTLTLETAANLVNLLSRQDFSDYRKFLVVKGGLVLQRLDVTLGIGVSPDFSRVGGASGL